MARQDVQTYDPIIVTMGEFNLTTDESGIISAVERTYDHEELCTVYKVELPTGTKEGDHVDILNCGVYFIDKDGNEQLDPPVNWDNPNS